MKRVIEVIYFELHILVIYNYWSKVLVEGGVIESGSSRLNISKNFLPGI